MNRKQKTSVCTEAVDLLNCCKLRGVQELLPTSFFSVLQKLNGVFVSLLFQASSSLQEEQAGERAGGERSPRHHAAHAAQEVRASH